MKILSDHLAGKTTNPVKDLDWERILHYGHIHQVEGIIYYQCKIFLPENVENTLQQAYSATLYYYKNREHTIQNIKNAFIDAGIPMVTVKGMDLAACYPVPGLRTMGDIDLLVHKEDKERASEVLIKLGFGIGEKTRIMIGYVSIKSFSMNFIISWFIRKPLLTMHRRCFSMSSGNILMMENWIGAFIFYSF